MIDLSVTDRSKGLYYNVFIDLANAFQINSGTDRISLVDLNKILDMRERYYNKLFTAKENLILGNYVTACNSVELLSIFDKITKVEFKTICKEMMYKYANLKNIPLDDLEFENYFKYIMDNKRANALRGSKHTSYLDPKETWKNKALTLLHKERVEIFKKNNLKELKRTEELIAANPKANMKIYYDLRNAYIYNFESELHYSKFLEYVRTVLNSYKTLENCYGKAKAERLLKKYGFEEKIINKDASSTADIRKNIIAVLRSQVTQEELNKIIKDVRNSKVKYNSELFKLLTEIVHLHDFYDRSFKLFKHYYKLDVIICLIVLFSAVENGSIVYEI